MRFLSSAECADWCARRDISMRERGLGGGVRPDLKRADFQAAEFRFPKDSGRKVSLARFLYSLVEPSPETLLWLDDWTVWPSSQHMPLFARFRQALHEHRPLSESPGHLITPADQDDAISIISVSLLFFWDCYGIAASGRDTFYVSHDEFGYFASRDAERANRVREQLSKLT
jgi:hypothetical protein